MKEWSVNCLGALKPKLFLDTNILSYLVDSTFPSLNNLILQLQQLCIFDIVSSDYCKNEFVGIRKREHYLRICVKKATEDGKDLNFSSLLKYHNQFDAIEVAFDSIIAEIKEKVKADLEHITTGFGIDFCCHLHPILANVANEICLSSKISKEDSLVIASSTSPEGGLQYENVILLTHDRDFVDWYNKAQDDINKVFNSYSLAIPLMCDSRKLFGNSTLNLDKPSVNIPEIIEQIGTWFVSRFDKYYIGKTLKPIETCPKQSFALRARLNKEIYQNKYIFIVGHNLDYMYVLPNRIDFYHCGKSVDNLHVFTDSTENTLTGLLSPYNTDDFTSKDLYQEILDEIRTESNYVFYLPEQ